MNDLLRKQDLESNPTPRVPICLCLDVSGSMGRIVGGTTRSTGKREYHDGKWWDIVEGGETALQEIVEGINIFYNRSCALFGGSLYRDFRRQFGGSCDRFCES